MNLEADAVESQTIDKRAYDVTLQNIRTILLKLWRWQKGEGEAFVFDEA